MAAAKLLASELANIARVIKDQFFTSFDADASISDVMDNLDAFDPKSRSILKALDKDDWLGFDNPVDAIDTALSDQINNYEVSTPLRSSITRAANQSSQKPPRKTPAPKAGRIASSNAITTGLLGNITDSLESAGMTLTDRLVSTGFLGPQYVDNPRQIKSATTKYTKSLENPAVAQREMAAAQNQFRTDFERADLGERRIVQPENMMGRLLIANRGDPSDIGLLRMVGGQDVGEVPVQGGYKFSQQNVNDGLGWASSEDIARSAHNRQIKMAEDSGLDPIAVYNRMGDDSTNFSTPPAQSLMTQVKQLPLSKQDKAAFDAELRLKYPKWVGLDDPNAMDQLMGQGDFKSIGKMRTAFTEIMGKAEYRDKGFPLYKETIDTVNSPELAKAEYGDAGMSMYTPRIDEAIRPIDTHLSYDSGMPGDYYGGLEQSVPFRVMMPDVYNSLKKEMTKPKATSKNLPRPFTHQEAIVAANVRGQGVGQPTDQKWLDNIRTYLETGKSLYSRPEAGLLAAGAAGAASMSPEQASAQIIEQKYTDPSTRTQVPPRSQMIRSPESGIMATMADTMGDINSGVRRLDPTGGLLAPELPEDLFRKSAYGEKRGVLDYLFGAMGMM